MGFYALFRDFSKVINYAKKRKKKYRQDQGGTVPTDQRDLDPYGLYLLCSFLEDPGAALPLFNPVSCEACRDTFAGCDPEACRVRFAEFCDQITPGDGLYFSRNTINRGCKMLEN